jgi:SAM-dependent methyltransferase
MQLELGQIVWLAGETPDAPPCPACGTGGRKALVLETPSLVEAQKSAPLRLVICGNCGTRYWTDLSLFEYEGEDGYFWSTRFYVEQGAAPDDLIGPIAALAGTNIQSYLEIGCGFGFSLDAGHILFGWRAVGIDPSPLARAGRTALDIDIRPIYADTDTELGGPFDLVYASEVIEHVPDPHAFLKICRAHIAPGGTLALSTPDGSTLGRDTTPALLMPILSPGHHLVLYTPESLSTVVRAAGFGHVAVVKRAHNIVLYASDRPFATDLRAPLDRELYRSYLRQAIARPRQPPELRTGLIYRLFRDLVNAGRYDDAQSIFEDIVEDCRSRFGFTLSPDMAPSLAEAVRRCEFKAPFCLPGLYFFKGLALLNGSPTPGEAAPWLDAALVAAQAFRAAYHTVGIDDGETGEIETMAAELAVLALCFTDPDVAAARARRLASQGADIGRVFMRLVDLGHLVQATGLEWAVDTVDDWQILGHRGVVTLLEAKDAQAAAKLFARAFTLAKDGPADERWHLKYHELLALLVAGNAPAAVTVATEIKSAGTAVPAEIGKMVDDLLEQHPAARPG